MIYLDLFLGFLKVGCFAFGGAYAAIPLIREVVLDYGWLTDDALTCMIAVSESTPGPIMINLATYVGSTQGGVLGSLLATFAVALPAFLLILLITAILKNACDNKYVKAVLAGLNPAIIGIILATGACMILEHCTAPGGIQLRPVILTIVLGTILYSSKKWLGKKLSPIQLILIAAAAGVIAYGV